MHTAWQAGIGASCATAQHLILTGSFRGSHQHLSQTGSLGECLGNSMVAGAGHQQAGAPGGGESVSLSLWRGCFLPGKGASYLAADNNEAWKRGLRKRERDWEEVCVTLKFWGKGNRLVRGKQNLESMVGPLGQTRLSPAGVEKEWRGRWSECPRRTPEEEKPPGGGPERASSEEPGVWLVFTWSRSFGFTTCSPPRGPGIFSEPS